MRSENRSCALLILLAAGFVLPGCRSFPAHGEIEYERSLITIPIYRDNETTPIEHLKLDAYMRLDREAPTRNGIGHRQFEFTIRDWELIGYSDALKAWFTFKLADVEQPKSICFSKNAFTDYPAYIVYSAIYDIWLNERRIVENRAGVAFAKNVYEIPPEDIIVAFEKPFELPPFRYRSGTCSKMRRITKEQFEHGATIASTIRRGDWKDKTPNDVRAQWSGPPDNH